jgi:hypothetical protein
MTRGAGRGGLQDARSQPSPFPLNRKEDPRARER